MILLMGRRGMMIVIWICRIDGPGKWRSDERLYGRVPFGWNGVEKENSCKMALYL